MRPYLSTLRSATDADFVNALRAVFGQDPLRQDGRAERDDTQHARRGRQPRARGPRGWNWQDDPRARSKSP